MTRKRHPSRVIEEAVRYAELNGWSYRAAGRSAHAWGFVVCPGDCPQFAVWSTPRVPDHHARAIRRAVDRCPHHRRIYVTTYNLTLLVAGIDEGRLDDIYQATDGAANVEIGDRWGSTVGFDIEADTFADAVLRAIDEIEEVPGLTVVRVEPDQLVWASEIAERVGRTRQSIDQLVKAQRGPGGFPTPISGNVRNPLWRWAEVEAWFAAYEHREVDTEWPAVVGAINGALEARRNLHARPDPNLAAKLEALISA